MSETGNIDFSQLHELSSGKESTAIEFIDLYLSRTSDTITDMNSHLNDKNWDALEIAAHNLRTNSRYMGIDKLSILAKDIEFFNHESGPGKMSLIEMITEAEVVFDEIKPELIEEQTRLNNLMNNS